MTVSLANPIELRLGHWKKALARVKQVDTLISDPPYSKRTVEGHNEGSASANRALRKHEVAKYRAKNGTACGKKPARRELGYGYWEARDVHEFVASWAPRVLGWFVVMTDHVLAPIFEASLRRAGRYVFAPLQYMQPGSRVRISGDGPALWSVTIVVARPATKEFHQWGALPGGYVLPHGFNERGGGAVAAVVGAKPLWIMQSLVRDYSRPGQLIVDPCAGGGTTLLAAAIEGRRALGAELDRATYTRAQARIARGYTPVLFPQVHNTTQLSLMEATS